MRTHAIMQSDHIIDASIKLFCNDDHSNINWQLNEETGILLDTLVELKCDYFLMFL